MTWTQEATTITSDAGCTAAFEYLFDTYLPAHGWTTAAHPTGNVQKRVFNYTIAENWLYPAGTSATHYFHSYRSSSGTTWTFYEDSTYTTTPGDLATDTTNTCALDLQNDPAAARFWVSDQNANSTLVTCGKRIIWYHPGMSVWGGCIDGAWDGSYDTNTTHIWPLHHGRWYHTNKPYYDGDHSSELNLIGSYDGTRDYTVTEPRVHTYIQNFDMRSSQASVVLFHVDSSDVLTFVSSGVGLTQALYGSAASGANGSLVNTGGRYYLHTNTSIEGQSLAFDFGTTEPDFT